MRILDLARRHRLVLPGCAVIAAFLFSGCINVHVRDRQPDTNAPSTDRPTQPVSWIRTELYFGRVADDEWKTFLEGTVTPRFPAGLTVLDAQGQWRGKDGVIHPVPTRILVILHPGDETSNRSLEEIRRAYTERFHHESVLRSDNPTQVSF
jgi:hypothetical protein